MTMTAADAYPLAWPQGWQRTARPTRSRFRGTADSVRKALLAEIKRLGGHYVVVSTNCRLRRDGAPYASDKPPRDTGVAVYFMRKGKQMVFACDRWNRVQDNMRAIQHTIAAIRGIERWGASEMLERSLSAFEALPPPTVKTCWQVLGLLPGASVQAINEAWRYLARKCHPDAGGSNAAMTALTAARDEAIAWHRTARRAA